jgi:hypothetical protein
MTKFTFIAVPLNRFERRNGITVREMEIMSHRTWRTTFEAANTTEAFSKFLSIAANLEKNGDAWHAWADIARGERSPRGFKKEKQKFQRDINENLVAV